MKGGGQNLRGTGRIASPSEKYRMPPAHPLWGVREFFCDFLLTNGKKGVMLSVPSRVAHF